MKNAMYMISFEGVGGKGMATLTFQDSVVYGFDEAGAIYDGKYEPHAMPNHVLVKVKVMMPAGQISVVDGQSRPFPWQLEVEASLPFLADTGTMYAKTNLGPIINVSFQRMRDVPTIAKVA